ncbi:hypothetical protein DFJ58DRAFT_734087 [Suillus subalutaceus]|uniref:uncharacterized protein n=1 Tax=Suillus subalutaceus TaxID=48586 RepID=UPI001B875539|nr:uncharacterized protein DFJ58DRAFT_734087 [Suillus subalutaceus]KAG1837988.1 hypothetical protein DFJ58DRAFT_734087 [Suillus subalutaceus]
MSLLIVMCQSSLTSSVQSDQEPLLKALLKEVEDWLENVCSCSSINDLNATFLNMINSTTEPNFLMPGPSENRSFLGLHSGYCSSSSASDIQNTYCPRYSKALICQHLTAQFKSHSVLEIRLNGNPVAFELFYVRAKTGRLQPRFESIYKWLKGFPATLDWLMTIHYIIPLNKRVKLSLPSSNPPSSPLQHLHSGPQPDPFILKEKADARAANVAQDKKEKEMEEQKEINRQREVKRQLEIERQKQLEIERQKQLEIKRQMEVERQKQLEIERQQEADRQRELEIKRQQDLEIERQKEADRQRELEHQHLKWVQKVYSGGRVIADNSMDVDIEPGKVTSGSHAPSPTKGKMDTVNHQDRSPCRPHAPFVPNHSCCSLSPPPHGSSYHASRRELSPPR